MSSLAWPEEEAGSLWGGEPRELLLVGRMDGTLGLLEVLDDSDLQRTELQHCFRKDGTDSFYETVNKTTFGNVHVYPRLLLFSAVAVMQIAWYSEDRPFAVGYTDGRLLIGSKEPSDNGSVVVIDAHKVRVIMIHHKLTHVLSRILVCNISCVKKSFKMPSLVH